MQIFLSCIQILAGRFFNRTSLVAQTVKLSAYNAGDPGSISGPERSLWRRK